MFELSVEPLYHEDRWRIGFSSRLCDIDEAILLSREWVRGEDSVYDLAEYIDRLFGRTLASLAESCRDPRRAARALLPALIAEIHYHMEEMERYGRASRMRDITINMPPIYMGMDFGLAPESKKSVTAQKKARALLLKNLDATQAKSFNDKGEFEVKSANGFVYRITTARSFNVLAPDGRKYCGQLADTPVEDQMLAQKLLLEHDPEKFFKNANVSGGDPRIAQGRNRSLRVDPFRY